MPLEATSTWWPPRARIRTATRPSAGSSSTTTALALALDEQRLDPQAPAAGHGLLGVAQEVQERPQELVPIAAHPRQVLGERHVDLDGRPRLERLQRLAHQVVHVEELQGEGRPA